MRRKSNNSKTRRVKKGGQKRNQTNYNPSFVTQTAGQNADPFSYNSIFTQKGGQSAPAPAPANLSCAQATNLPNLDETSLIESLQTYGDTVWAMQAAAKSAVDAATQATTAVGLQNDAASTYQSLVTQLAKAFYGDSTAGTKGLYKSITGTPYVPPPSPAPAPA
jgi:hypothetical protein